MPDGPSAGAPKASLLGVVKRWVVGKPLATHAAAAPAPVEDGRPRDLLLGRGRVERVRHPGDPPRPRPGARHGRHRLPRTDLAPGRRAARHRRVQLPPDDRRVPERRRLLHRQQGQPRHRARASSPARRCSSTTRSRSRSRSRRAPPRSPPPSSRCATTPSPPRGACWSLLTVANLRGVRESGRLFAPPTYGYIAIMVVLIGVRPGPHRRSATSARCRSTRSRSTSSPRTAPCSAGASLFLLMRAFSSGAIALSGVEAISNGVPAFRPPETRNAATTLTWTGAILAALFVGVAALALQLQPTLSEDQTILSTMGRAVFGSCERPLLPAADLHRGDPRAVGQHRLRRLPPPVGGHRHRRLPAPPAREPRRPPGVLQRDHRPGARLGRAAGRLRGRRLRAGAALRRGAVRQLHAQPGRHGPSTTCRLREPGWRRPRDQRARRGGHRRRAGRGARLEVHVGRLGPDRRDPRASSACSS